MSNFTRREFIATSIAGIAGIAGGKTPANAAFNDKVPNTFKPVILGKTGIKVSRVAFGTGTHGWKHVSDQTRLGRQKFVELLRYAYDRGITFFDVADIYGSHEYLHEALKYIPREKIVIITKSWPAPLSWKNNVDAKADVERFRKEIGTDYLDIVLLHCLTDADWPEKLERQRDALSEAKEQGIIKAHGCSCHSVDALKAAADSPWAEVVFTRINHTGERMDDKPEVVLPVIKQIHKNGKAVVGMKIYGCGEFTSGQQREASLRYVLGSKCVDAMTIGFVEKAQIDDTFQKIDTILG